MEENGRENRRTRFIEDFGAVFEFAGVPRMAGRIVGYLLMSNREAVPTSELVEQLEASKGAISTATRMLTQFKMIERFHVRGSRETHYRVPPALWGQAIRQKLAVMGQMRALAEQGMEAVEDRPSALARLQEMHDIYSFFERELPALYEQFERQRNRG